MRALLPLLVLFLAGTRHAMHIVDYCTRCQSTCQYYNAFQYASVNSGSNTAPVKEKPEAPAVPSFKQSDALIERSKKNCPSICPTRCPFPNMDDDYCKENCFKNCPNYAV